MSCSSSIVVVSGVDDVRCEDVVVLIYHVNKVVCIGSIEGYEACVLK